MPSEGDLGNKEPKGRFRDRSREFRETSVLRETAYRMELAEGSIAFPNVQKLISQTAVRTGIAGKLGTLIPPFKASHWRRWRR